MKIIMKHIVVTVLVGTAPLFTMETEFTAISLVTRGASLALVTMETKIFGHCSV